MADLNLRVLVDVKGAEKLRSLGGTLAGGAVGFAKFAAAGGAAFAGLGVVTANFASDLDESINKVNVVFPKTGKMIENWSKNAASDLGLSQQAALEATGTFGNLFTAMGLSEVPAANMSQDLITLASDLASFNNIGTDEALEKLRAGLVGEAEPLRTLGVQLSAARVEAHLMEQGVKKVNGEFTEAQKVQARFALIMQDTSKAQGDFSRTSDGMANQQRILSATFEDTMATLGQAFVPIIQELLPGITEGLKGFGEFVQSNMPAIKEVAGTVFGGIGTAIGVIINDVLPRLGEAFNWLSTNVFPILMQVGAQIGQVIGFVAQNVVPGLIAAFQGVVSWVTANWPTISSIIGQVFGAITNVIQTVWPIVESIATVLFPIVGTAAGVLFNVLDKAFKLIGGVFETVGNVAETVVETITGAWDVLSSVTEEVWNAISGTIKGAINIVIGIINGFIGAINGIQIHIPGFDTPFGKVAQFDWWGLNLPTIPMLAEGGIISGPTLALLGESGPEAVIPLDRSQPFGNRVLNLTVTAPLRANDMVDIVEYIDRAERLTKAMDWEPVPG